MSYQQFAFYYDQLMEDAPYGQWIDFFEETIQSLDAKVANVLDVGCGTGSISVRLAQKGYDVTGIDLSEDMLAMAREKSIQSNAPVRFFQQDMTALEGLNLFDAAVIFCDSLNYIVSEEDVLNTFQSINSHLKEEGLLLFDVHSLYKIHHIFTGNTFGTNDEALTFIWQCFEGEYPDSVEHDLSFFVQDEGDRYSRFDELHIQRTFSIDVYSELLKKAGFELLKVTGDFSNDGFEPRSERIFFICRKQK